MGRPPARSAFSASLVEFRWSFARLRVLFVCVRGLGFRSFCIDGFCRGDPHGDRHYSIGREDQSSRTLSSSPPIFAIVDFPKFCVCVDLRSSRSGPPRGDRGLDKFAEAAHLGPIATWSAWEASNGALRVSVPIMDTPKARGHFVYVHA